MVESVPSKFPEADLQTGITDSLFIKSPKPALADNRSPPLTFRTIRTIGIHTFY